MIFLMLETWPFLFGTYNLVGGFKHSLFKLLAQLPTRGEAVRAEGWVG